MAAQIDETKDIAVYPEGLEDEKAFWNECNLRVYEELVKGSSIKQIALLTNSKSRIILAIIAHPVFTKRYSGFLMNYFTFVEARRYQLAMEALEMYWGELKEKVKDGHFPTLAKEFKDLLLGLKELPSAKKPQKLQQFNIGEVNISKNEEEELKSSFGIKDHESEPGNTKVDKGVQDKNE